VEKVHCMSLSSIHIHYNHDPVQAQLCTQRVWERVVITFRTEVVGWLRGHAGNDILTADRWGQTLPLLFASTSPPRHPPPHAFPKAIMMNVVR
jgi:hypothetical protein